jgi:DNA replication protein DnaC
MSCPLCNDTGWKHVERDGRSAVTRCDCWRASLAETLKRKARVAPRYRNCNLDQFATYDNPSLEEAVRCARALVKQFPVVSKGLFFLGPPGVGKTHLAVAILNQIVHEKRAHALFYDTRDLLRVIRETYDPVARQSERDVLRPVMDAELLVLDDLGAERTTDWVDEMLNLIVNTRYNERRLTLFTSNYRDSDDLTDMESLQIRIGLRMYSRLREMCDFLDLDGADYRELPENGGVDDLHRLWEKRHRLYSSLSGKLPTHSRSQVRAGLPPPLAGLKRAAESIELKWMGGKVETKAKP